MFCWRGPFCATIEKKGALVFDDLETLFLDSVLGSYNEFSQSLKSDRFGQSHDIRLGMNAATALYHFREHMPSANQKSRWELAAICPDYDLLGDIVNAGKHREVTRRRTPLVKEAEDIQEVIVMTEYEDADGPYQHQRKTVEVTLTDRSTRELKDVLRAVTHMWIAELKALGLVPKLQPAPPPVNADIPPRQTPSGAAKMNYVVNQGQRFFARYRRQRYNHATGKVEPVDITGHTYEYTIRKPRPLELQLAMINKQDGRRVERTVQLTEEEADRFRRLTADDDRKQFGREMAGKYDLIAQLVADARKTS